MLGSPKAKWSPGKAQTKSNSQDSDGNTEPRHPPGARPWEGSWSSKSLVARCSWAQPEEMVPPPSGPINCREGV